MPRILLSIAYVGTHYCGWQIQAGASRRPQPTIQGMLESIVSKVVGTHIRVHGSGRTDSGVHADAQMAHFDVPESKVTIDWQRALNAQLPDDIAVFEAKQVPDDFHVRYSATGKIYTYRLWLSRRYTPPTRFPYVWACGPVDVSRMDEAAQSLLGTYDCACFQNVGTNIKGGTERTIRRIERIPKTAIATGDQPVELAWEFEANGFLKQMVRNLVGLLVACGREKISVTEIPQLIASKNRSLLPPTAPAKGLTMTRVQY